MSTAGEIKAEEDAREVAQALKTPVKCPICHKIVPFIYYVIDRFKEGKLTAESGYYRGEGTEEIKRYIEEDSILLYPDGNVARILITCPICQVTKINEFK
jgi:hypothetical protein